MREKEEEEAAAMLLDMKKKAEKERRRELIQKETAALQAELERPIRAYLEKKRLGLFNPQASRRLLKACMNGNESEVLQAIDDGADVNYKDSTFGWTGLILACTYGHLNCVSTMLSLEGAIVNENARDNYGVSPILAAAAASRTDIVQALINMRRGRIDLDAKDKKGRTALLVAQARSCFEERSYPSTVSILQNAGAKG